MKRYQREIFIARPMEVVFDYFADMTHTAEWAVEDFASVTREDRGPIRLGSYFAFVTRGTRARSAFVWDVFDKPHELEFSGDRLTVGPGWVTGSGGYVLWAVAGGTSVTAWFEPKLGGLLALVAPFARIRNIRLLGTQLARAKALIEAK